MQETRELAVQLLNDAKLTSDANEKARRLYCYLECI